MNKPFELGPIQKQWLADLRKYPERQMPGALGVQKKDGSLCLCCLGQALVTMCSIKGGNPFFKYGDLYDGDNQILLNSYRELGLMDPEGQFINERESGFNCWCLAEMNDKGVPWPEIADYIEANPTNVFTEPK